MKDLQTLLLSLFKTGGSTAAHSLTSKGMLFLQHNLIFSISLCHSQNPICYVFNLMKYRYTVARSLFLRLNRIILGSNTPVLSELESNTDAMQAIRHVGRVTGVKPSDALLIYLQARTPLSKQLAADVG